ncbi:MAG: hypothetical protein WBB25_22055 [Sulfitobacter sp.]
MTLPRLRTFALSALMLGAIGTATAPLWAQQTPGARGVQLAFGVTLGLETQSNRALDPADPGRSSDATMGLSLGVLSETRTQRFSFDLGGELRSLNGPNSTDNGFANPSVALRYDRTSAAARLSLSASVRESDQSDDGLIFDETTQVFTFVDGTATRRNTALSAQLNWRDDAPLGFGVLARMEDNSYRNGVATGIGGTTLNDTRRLTLGATARLDLNEASQLNLGLNYSEFEEDGTPGTRATWTLTNALTINRPDGPLTVSLDVTDTEDGTRVATSVARSLEYPLGIVSGRIGATRGVTGEVFLSGGLNATRALPRGNLSVSLARDVNSGQLEDTEQVSTRVSFGYQHELNALSSLSLDASWVEVNQTGTNVNQTNASIGATYRRELTTDWNMDVGVRHRFSDDGVSGKAQSNELFLNLRRDFLTRF